MSCWGCDAAKLNPRTACLHAECQECLARWLASGPIFYDAQQAGEFTDRYRHELNLIFGADIKGGHQRVKDWAERIAACPKA